MIDAESRVGWSHDKIASLKGKTVVTFLKKEFQLLRMVRILFHRRLDYLSIIYLKISYKIISSSPHPPPVLWQRCEQFINSPIIQVVDLRAQHTPQQTASSHRSWRSSISCQLWHICYCHLMFLLCSITWVHSS